MVSGVVTGRRVQLARPDDYACDRTERSLIPIEKVLTNGTVAQTTAKSINYQAKKVVLENGKELSYDALVIATGSRNFSPGDAPRSVTSKEGLVAYFSDIRAAISKTKNVVIVGSGAVGIELAGEIREYGQKGAKITIVSRSKQILNDGMKYRESGIAAILKDLAKLEINLINGDEVASHPLPANLAEASPIVQTPEGVTLKSGKKIPCDLLIFATGSVLNTEFLPTEWLDNSTKEVVVDQKTLLVQGQANVFAVGDIAKLPSAKRGYFASEDAKVVAKNVIQVLKGAKPSNKIQRMNMIVLTLGSKGGRVLLPFTTLGPKIASMAKSKDLFVKMFWGQIAPGMTPPKA